VAWVATVEDFVKLGGLPRSALRADALPIESVDPSNNRLELPGHFYTGGERVRLATINGSLPGGLSAAWQTVAPPEDPDFFSLVGVTLTDAGEGAISVIEDVTPGIVAILAAWTSFVVAKAKAYAGPWTTPPAWAPLTVCQLAAPDVASLLRLPPARYPIEQVAKAREAQWKFVTEELGKGEPMSDGVGPVDATRTADNAPALVELADLDTFSLCGGRA